MRKNISVLGVFSVFFSGERGGVFFWFFGSLVLWFFGSLGLWVFGSLGLCFFGSLVLGLWFLVFGFGCYCRLLAVGC